MRTELENRLVELALNINEVCRSLDGSYLSQHIINQIIRSSTSAALNYGEAQAAESKKDFIHKVSLVLKELRETKVSLKLLKNSVRRDLHIIYKNCQSECDQLIAIFHKTVISARAKLAK
ncbi:MAG: four helix bundle protein [Bacteroidales bacterium]|jgi:four helix bundle protein|nr:four helix bundle protein [Bacteroidales bacterium]